jgi:methylglutaconyl-CoA hydratase
VGITYEVVCGVATLRFDRPESKNAMNLYMWRELKSALVAAEGDGDVDIIVLTADREFVSGGDIKEAATVDARTFTDASYAVYKQLLTTPKTVISCVNGLAFGAGTVFVLMSDLACASTNASFGVPEAKIPLVEPYTALTLPTHLGMKRTKELIFTGDPMSAADAERHGIVNVVVSPEELPGALNLMIARVRRTDASARAGFKTLLNTTYFPDYPIQMVLQNLASEDFLAGVKRFAERSVEA